jgi:hypothetical protein
MNPESRPALRRRRALALLGLGVAALHGLLAHWLPRPGAVADGVPALQRMEVAFVRELQPAAPPPPPRPGAAPAPARPGTARLLAPPEPAPPASPAEDPPQELPESPPEAPPAPPPPAASPPPPGLPEDPLPEPWPGHGATAEVQPQPSAPPPVAPPEPAADATGQPESAQPPAPGTSIAEALPAPDDGEAGPEWPLSTRLSYALTGNFRGPVEGQARVEWLRQGGRYQVHLDLSVGPFFAPLAGRRLSSEGRITPAGLHPERYEEETRVAFRPPRRLRIELGPTRLRLPGGRELPRPEGVQDSASQFVHMTWLFTLQPGRLQPGSSLELPLALPRSVEPWTYDVVGADTLPTPMGELPVVHVRPRREPQPGRDLTAEFWVAPTLQYLPVRILIRQSEEVWVDLRLDRLPQQAAAAAPYSENSAAPRDAAGTAPTRDPP